MFEGIYNYEGDALKYFLIEDRTLKFVCINEHWNEALFEQFSDFRRIF